MECTLKRVICLVLTVALFAQTGMTSAQSRYSVAQKGTESGEPYTIISLENEFLRVEILPELGSKIASIYHKKLDWEYLDRSGKPYRGRTYDMAFSETETDGFDECFPSISRTAYPQDPWKEIIVPDHGEICMVPARFRIVNIPSGGERIVTITNGVRFPYEFERTISLEGEAVIVDYRVRNLSAFDFSYLYAAHPLFRPEPGMRIELPPETRLLSGNERGWPMLLNRFTGAIHDRSIIQPAAVRQMAKLFTEKLKEGWAVAHFPDGKFLRVDFPADKLPYLGIWIDEGGLWDLYQFAFEPTTATTDDLKSAAETGQAVILPPFELHTWQVRYSFGKK